MPLLSFNEARALGVLIEKAQTTPDLVPLTLNSCVLGCNQTSNRYPIVYLGESEVELALEALMQKKLVVRIHGVGARTVKYNHIVEMTWGLKREAICLLSILLLRGDQTPGDLSTRSKRSCPDLSLAGVLNILEELSSGEKIFVNRLERMPGQKEARWRCCLTEAPEQKNSEPKQSAESSGREESAFSGEPSLREEFLQMREELQFLRDEVQSLSLELKDLKSQLNG